MSEKQVTILEEIIKDIGVALFQKWMNALSEEERTEERSTIIAANASETTIFIIQMFMDRFNQAAEDLKPVQE